MVDFFMIATRSTKRDVIEIYPKFIARKSSDLMIRGGDFYAVWLEDRGLWSTDEDDLIQLIDHELDIFAEDYREKFHTEVKVLHMWDAETGMIDNWHKFCQRQMRDSYSMLDEKLIFSNAETNKKDYASKRLNYPLEPGSIAAYDKIISTLYTEEERHKIEWAIGSIVTGDSKHLQKFLVLYGEAGTGKSTILNIVQQLFEGYYAVFDAKALGSSGDQFALEAFKNNPLVAIQHDGDLSKIEDNTRLNSLVSHELMTVNEKFKGRYSNRFKAFLFLGTNRPVKITDAKSGLIRRLVDVTPSGNKLSRKDYFTLTKQVEFELGAIACHCRDVYLADPGRYDDYIPKAMLGASNDFYNFMIDSFHVFKRDDSTTLKAAWEMYKTYCEEAKVPYPMSQRPFKEELRNYFKEYKDRHTTADGNRVRNYYSGFRLEKFEDDMPDTTEKPKVHTKLIQFVEGPSIFDTECSDCPAQYATKNETPTMKWDKVTSKLSELDTSKVHYVKVPENHIVIDFDISDENGNKCFEKNVEAASKWPATYAELSKSGSGVHLHYIYTGDVSKLSRIYEEHIEIKVSKGGSSLRRKLSKCNNLPIATISSGLPMKGEKMVNRDAVKSEKGLRTLIIRNLNKEIMGATKPSIDFIHKILEDAYNGELCYDVSDMKNDVLAFAANSTHQADYCIKVVSTMKFKSEEPSLAMENEDKPIVFYDVEVFPNLFLVNWKIKGPGKPVVRMINPTPSEIEELLRYRLIGFNCRRYDNHIMYARLMGYSNEQLYKLSQKLINKDKNVSMKAMFGEAFNLSYTDVYDFSTDKMSLKKWEIKLGIHHQELGLPWDEPVPEALWPKVAEYCDNDVIATEAVFDHLTGDWMARRIQVDLVRLLHGMTTVTVNDTTNTLSKRIIFGKNRKPQGVFNWRDLSQPVPYTEYEDYRRRFGEDYIFRVFDEDGLPLYRDYIPGEVLPAGYSILPFFKGYVFDRGESTYMGEVVGEGGRVFAKPGMWFNVWDGDIASQHPHSAIAECIFGPEFTKRFEEIVQARVAIKHKDFDTAGKLLGGALKPYLNEEFAADLAQALKIVINSIYGLTSAAFENEFRDPRNIDNIVAKRGNLFMTLLKSEVEKRGFTVCHIKTDSIKIPNATKDIQDFVIKFGKEYGYTFETEANFEKFCLVNDAVYVASENGKWSATGKQFAVPYVFKKLFSGEEIVFDDLCESFEVKAGNLYLDMNEGLPDVTAYEKELDKLIKKRKKLEPTDPEYEVLTKQIEELIPLIDAGHKYQFIGRVGRFCPVVNGGVLYRGDNGKFFAAAGTTGYRWLESEHMRELDWENLIDMSYYRDLYDKAMDKIGEFGDAEQFIHGTAMFAEDLEDLPWRPDCGRDTCIGCPNLYHDAYHMDCNLGYDISDFVSMNTIEDDAFKKR